MTELKREPPASVKLELRKYVNHGCPIPRCGSPFLEYHHFDPTWADEPHMNPDGMIPLCPSHHAQAESWNAEDLRSLKIAANKSGEASGRFEWLKRDFLVVVGGTMAVACDTPVKFREEKMIWFERDELGLAQLNVRMLTTSALREQRLRIDNNDFSVRGDPVDFVCPPSGRLLRARYSNGDYLRLQFRLIEDVAHAARVFPAFEFGLANIPNDVIHGYFPIASLEISMHIGGRTRMLAPNTLRWSGMKAQGLLTVAPAVALSLT